MLYEPNPKHKAPWQPGRKGSLCPTTIQPATSEALLAESVLDGEQRFATDGERAFAAHEHQPGKWHGHPVGWKEVPERIRRAWLDEGRIIRKHVRRFWESSE